MVEINEIKSQLSNGKFESQELYGNIYYSQYSKAWYPSLWSLGHGGQQLCEGMAIREDIAIAALAVAVYNCLEVGCERQPNLTTEPKINNEVVGRIYCLPHTQKWYVSVEMNLSLVFDINTTDFGIAIGCLEAVIQQCLPEK